MLGFDNTERAKPERGPELKDRLVAVNRVNQ